MSDPSPDPASPEAAFIERAEERLRILREIREIGMDLMRALGRRAEAEAAAEVGAEESAPVAKRDPADAFQRLSRAVRLTLAMEAKTDEALRALIAGEAEVVETRRAEAAARAAKARAERHEAKKDKVEDVMIDVIDAEVGDAGARECRYALDERLDEDEAYEDLADKPLREIVERLCVDLGLTPDWSQWDGEGWALPPGAWRPAHSIFNQISRVPVGRPPPSRAPASPQPWGARLE